MIYGFCQFAVNNWSAKLTKAGAHKVAATNIIKGLTNLCFNLRLPGPFFAVVFKPGKLLGLGINDFFPFWNEENIIIQNIPLSFSLSSVPWRF